MQGVVPKAEKIDELRLQLLYANNLRQPARLKEQLLEAGRMHACMLASPTALNAFPLSVYRTPCSYGVFFHNTDCIATALLAILLSFHNTDCIPAIYAQSPDRKQAGRVQVCLHFCRTNGPLFVYQ
jgi:hypothetical protein